MGRNPVAGKSRNRRENNTIYRIEVLCNDLATKCLCAYERLVCVSIRAYVYDCLWVCLCIRACVLVTACLFRYFGQSGHMSRIARLRQDLASFLYFVKDDKTCKCKHAHSRTDTKTNKHVRLQINTCKHTHMHANGNVSAHKPTNKETHTRITRG